MKKLLLLTAAFASMLFASCSKEEMAPQANETTVSYTVEIPSVQTKGSTKSIGDGLNTKQLIYEVWKTDGENVTDLKNSVRLFQKTTHFVDSENGKLRTVISLNLVQDQEYTILFWAQNEDNTPYNTTNLTAVTYKDGSLSSNKEDYAAFYAVDFISDSDPRSKTVTLYRPFAQLNIGTLNTADDYTVTMKNSEVTIDGIPTVFNVATSVATDFTSVVFNYNAVPADPAKFNVGGTDYQYAAMNYVFASKDGINDVTVTYNIESTLKADKGNGTETTAVVNNTVLNVPLKENYRTNIVGNLLTSTTEYEVIVDAKWDHNDDGYVVDVWDGSSLTEPKLNQETNTYELSKASDLAWLAAAVNGTLRETKAATADNFAGKTFKLTSDIDLNNQLWTPIGTDKDHSFNGTFDGNGYTIKNLSIIEEEAKEGKAFIGFIGYAKDATIMNVVFENVNLNIACLDIDHSQGHIGAVAGSLEGTSTIENVTIKGDIKVESTVTANGASRVAVVAGGNSYGNVTMKNVHIVANKGSYLKANNNVGALAGQLQGVSKFENCSSNIDVTGTKFFAGGIIGLAAGDQTFTDCHTTGNITITAGREGRAHDHYRVGGIAGGWADGATKVCTLTNCSYTGTISGTNSNGSVANPLDYAGYVGRGYTLNGCAGSKVVIDGVEYVQAFNTAAEAGIYYIDGALTINSAAELKLVADMVNAGTNYFEGKTIKLGADIDLNNEEWTPIGSAYKDHGFMGNFEGNGYKIKNLTITKITPDSDGYAYAALFGVTEGSEAVRNYIKNLTIENVNISTEGHIVSAAIAYPYYTTVENIAVTGDIKIKGGNYTSGVLAYTRRLVDAKNISIVGDSDSDSHITGNETVGGVISDIQMNGGLTANYSNFSAKGLTITAKKSVGGISGIISLQTLDGATVENVNICSDDIRKGIVAGALGGKSTIKNISVTNVTGATNVVGATFDNPYDNEITVQDDVYSAVQSYSVSEDGKTYTISSATGLYWFANEVNVNKNSFSGKTVKLGANIDLANQLWIPVGQTGATTFNGVFDGQNFTISNLNINSEDKTGAHYSSGLFGWVETHSDGNGQLMNVKIDGATVVGHHNCGALVGYITEKYAKVANCHVSNATITCTYANGDADGDKAGALIGNATNATKVDGCTAVNSTVSAGRDSGQLIGAGRADNITNCSATNVTVTDNGTGTGNNIRNEVIGRLL